MLGVLIMASGSLKGVLIYSASGTGGTPSSASAAHEKVNGEAFFEKKRLDGRSDSETLSLPLCIQINQHALKAELRTP